MSFNKSMVSFRQQLIKLADVIRKKTGQTNKMSLDDMISDINFKLADSNILGAYKNRTFYGTNFAYMFYYCDMMYTVPNLDTSKGTNFLRMFYHCELLKTVPKLDTSKGTNFSYMFFYCYSLKAVPSLDTGRGTNFSFMLYNCASITTAPELNVTNGTDFPSMFAYCRKLTTVKALDTSKGTNFKEMFGYDGSLESIEQINLSKATDVSYMFYKNDKLTNVNIVGTINIDELKLNDSPLLTHESIMSFINALVDRSSETEVYTIYFGSTNLAKLTEDELHIMSSKNWNYA